MNFQFLVVFEIIELKVESGMEFEGVWRIFLKVLFKDYIVKVKFFVLIFLFKIF